MAQIYVLVRFANLVLAAVLLVMAILDLIKLIDSPARDTVAITSMAITGVVLFLGAYGSFKHDRQMLTTFAVIAIIAMIVGFVSKANIYVSLGMLIVLIVLSLTQAELIKRGYY